MVIFNADVFYVVALGTNPSRFLQNANINGPLPKGSCQYLHHHFIIIFWRIELSAFVSNQPHLFGYEASILRKLLIEIMHAPAQTRLSS